MGRRLIVIAALLAAVMTGCCGGVACGLPSADVLVVKGYVIESVTSSCKNVYVLGGVVTSSTFDTPQMCHFVAVLDDRQVIQLDVSFDEPIETKCCGSTITRYGTKAAPLTITAPPGYVPHKEDAGVDAAIDATTDDASADATVADAVLE